MGADGGIYYYEDSSENPFFTQLLWSLIDWICSEKCPIEFSIGSLFVKDDTIYIYDNENGQTEDDAVQFFTPIQLEFVYFIKSHISDFCSYNSSIPEDKDNDCDTWEIDEALNKAGSLWFYWDTNSMHSDDPFDSRVYFNMMCDKLNRLYDKCIKCPTSAETFNKIFSDKNMFSEFTSYYLPEPDYVEAWT